MGDIICPDCSTKNVLRIWRVSPNDIPEQTFLSQTAPTDRVLARVRTERPQHDHVGAKFPCIVSFLKCEE